MVNKKKYDIEIVRKKLAKKANCFRKELEEEINTLVIKDLEEIVTSLDNSRMVDTVYLAMPEKRVLGSTDSFDFDDDSDLGELESLTKISNYRDFKERFCKFYNKYSFLFFDKVDEERIKSIQRVRAALLYHKEFKTYDRKKFRYKDASTSSEEYRIWMYLTQDSKIYCLEESEAIFTWKDYEKSRYFPQEKRSEDSGKMVYKLDIKNPKKSQINSFLKLLRYYEIKFKDFMSTAIGKKPLNFVTYTLGNENEDEE
jgi:hypothetical protein